jgi:cation diffusion facilitator CzcD-associated flavoprotein CzcO
VSERVDIAVIGAGPAGLSLGYELRRHGISFVVLEKGGGPGHSWAQMASHIKLLSPWIASSLQGSESWDFRRYSLLSQSEFNAYLVQFSGLFNIPVRCGTAVLDVSRKKGEEGFTLQLADGMLRARFVVNATGYFSNPLIPATVCFDGSIPVLHSSEFRDVQSVVSVVERFPCRALVVGKRISAGQVGLELHDAGCSVDLSFSGVLRHSLPDWVYRAIFPFYYPYEDLRTKLHPYHRTDSEHLMEGGRIKCLIRDGTIGTRPELTATRSKMAVFKDGSTLAYDLILLATGFRPALAHLRKILDGDLNEFSLRGFEAPGVRNLFFLGMDMQRSFRSRFLRGIREDAVALGAILKSRVSEEG